LTKLNEKLTEKKSELSKLSREYEGAKLNFSSESNTLVERCDKLMQLVSQHEYKVKLCEWDSSDENVFYFLLGSIDFCIGRAQARKGVTHFKSEVGIGSTGGRI